MSSRREFLRALGVGSTALAAAGAAGAPALAQEQVTWRVAHFSGDTSMFYTLTILPFIERVRAMTDGQVELQPFPGGVIAPPLETYQAVEDGLVDAGHLTPLYIVNRDPVNSFYGGHPGGMPAEMFLHWLYNGGGQDLLAEHRRETMNMHSMVLSIGPAEIWHSHKEIRTADDLRGIRFRTAGAWATILSEYFEAAATTVPGSELYTMLERGGVDVAEWSGPAENIKMGLQNAAPYIIMPGAHTNAFSFEFLVSADRWDALDDTLKEKVEAAAKLSTFETLLAWTMEDLAAMDEVRSGQTELIELDPSLIEAIREAGRDWAMKRAEEQEAQGNSWMRRVAESYYDFYDGWLNNATYRAID